MDTMRNLGSLALPLMLNLLPFAGTLRAGRRARIPQYGQRPSNVGTARRRRNVRRFGNGQYKKEKKGMDGRSGLEINRAEGGYKGVYQRGKFITQSIDMYDGIYLASKNYNIPSAYTFSGNSDTLMLTDLINLNPELMSVKTIAYKYRVTGIRLSFDYSTVVPSLTTLTKLVLTPETDLIKVEEPLINKASMVLSMSRMGVKNYWFNLNKGNMKEDNVEWIDSEFPFYGNLRIHINGQGQNHNPLEEPIKLGVLKISVIVRYVQKDVASVALGMKRKELLKLHLPLEPLKNGPIVEAERKKNGSSDSKHSDDPPGLEDEDSKSFGAPDLDVIPISASKDGRQGQIDFLVNKINDLRIDLNALKKGKEG